MSQVQFDEATAVRLEAMYHIADAVRRRRLVREALAAVPGESILDVGCGPGFYCAELAREVGPAGSVIGVDPSSAMLELARRRCADLTRVDLREGEATAIPVDDSAVDGAICVQVMEYVVDPIVALKEMWRVVKPGGRVVVWDVDWGTVSLQTSDPARNARVLRAWDQHLVHPSLPRTLTTQLREAGFDDVRMQAHPFATNAFDPEAYGPAMLPNLSRFVVGRDGITAEEAKAWFAEQKDLGEAGEFYFACTQVCFTATRPG